MKPPEHVEIAIIGAGIHGLSTAWRLAEHLGSNGRSIDKRVAVFDKAHVAAGASGIACGVVRNNYFQPAMRRLMAHSVDVWESDPEALCYNPVGYMQISSESMHEDVASIYEQQREIGYESAFIEGESACRNYMKAMFSDWRARNVTSILHEKRGGYSHNTRTMQALARRVESLGVGIHCGIEVTGFEFASESGAVSAIVTNAGTIRCDHVVIAAGPWVRDFWSMLGLPEEISVQDGQIRRDGVAMWRYWQLEEGVLDVPPESFRTDDGKMPPVLHIDTDAPLISVADGSILSEDMWGIYFKPDPHFGGVQGGASPYRIDAPASKVAVDPYGPSSPQYVASRDFAVMWVSALAHCHERFQDRLQSFRDEPSGGLGCFTPDSFPVFDHFHGNATVIADSNHGWKMIGVGHLIADEILGREQDLLAPFRFNRFERGELHPISNSPYPWS